MSYPQHIDCSLFDLSDAQDLFAYLYSYALVQERTSVSQLRRVGVNAYVQSELDVWIATKDRKPIRISTKQRKQAFIRDIGENRWYFYPSDSKLFNIRFDDNSGGCPSLYAEIRMKSERPEIVSIFPGNLFLDSRISTEAESQNIQMLNVANSGQRALLFPKNGDIQFVARLRSLSLGIDDDRDVRPDNFQFMSLDEFILSVT